MTESLVYVAPESIGAKNHQLLMRVEDQKGLAKKEREIR